MSLINTLPVTLGGLELSGLEVPSFFDRVGRVRVVAHPVIGGGRALQVTGYDPVRRELNGMFVGAEATERAQILEAMRDKADPLLLTIGAWTELVLIASLAIRYAERGSVVSYLIQAEVVSDPVTSYIQTEAAVISGAIASLAISLSILSSSGSPNQSSAIVAVQTGLSTAGSVLSSSLSGGSAAAVDLMTPGLGLMNVIEETGGSLTSFAASGGPDLVPNAAGLNAATGDAGLLATATSSGAYLNQAASQLGSLNAATYEPVVSS